MRPLIDNEHKIFLLLVFSIRPLERGVYEPGRCEPAPDGRTTIEIGASHDKN
jgi:hypothetical protein